MYVFVSESLICAPMYGSLPRGQGRTAQGGRHLTGYRWQQQTDRDIGDINTLINNYLNNDTGHTGGGLEEAAAVREDIGGETER